MCKNYITLTQIITASPIDCFSVYSDKKNTFSQKVFCDEKLVLFRLK